jgi:hypothetical protein
MKRPSSSLAKEASNLYQSIHLNTHALAAVVALVSVLALAPSSQAKIVYTHANVTIVCAAVPAMHNPFSSCIRQYNLDLNHDGVTDFTISVSAFHDFGCVGGFGVGELPASGNGAIGSGYYAAALMQGAQIGHGQQFIKRTGTMAYYKSDLECRHRSGGPWLNVTDRYLGLSFRRNGRVHYGWAKLTVHVVGDAYAHLTGYAYETIAGKSIKAGQTKDAADDPTNEDFGPSASLTSSVPDIPQPASLGMLALGAQAVPLWRRKESALEGNWFLTLQFPSHNRAGVEYRSGCAAWAPQEN